jgi:hypothetical protein
VLRNTSAPQVTQLYLTNAPLLPARFSRQRQSRVGAVRRATKATMITATISAMSIGINNPSLSQTLQFKAT